METPRRIAFPPGRFVVKRRERFRPLPGDYLLNLGRAM